MKALLIAEKNSLAKAVYSVYKNNGFKDSIDFFALHGHIMSLYDPGEYKEEWQHWSFDTIPLIPDEFKYKVSDTNLYEKLVAQLENGHYDYLINCCDPDREGQHIFYSIYDTLGLNLPVYRMWHNDLSDSELNRALTHMEDDLHTPSLVCLKEASKLRAEMDWLVGMNASRIVSLKRKSVTRLGRVMTPTFKILADREKAIRDFVPKTNYGIEAEYEEGFKAKMVASTDGKKLENVLFDTTDEANKIIRSLKDKAIVQSIETRETKEEPDQLPSLADIQAEANKLFGFTLDNTLNLVQSLYEKKLVSYPRTDCCYVTKEVAKDFNKILSALKVTRTFGPFIDKISDSDIDKVKKNKNYVNDEKVTAHYALIPTGNLKAQLNEGEKKLFEIICKRFVSIFLSPYKTRNTKVILKCDNNLFLANGKVIIDKGFKELMGFDKKDEMLPELKKDQMVNVKQYHLNEHTTKAPSRFSDASLLNAMINASNYIEDKELSDILKGDGKVKDSGGIGTPATRSAIVEKIVTPVTNKDGMTYYLAYRKNKVFYVTDEGLDLADSLSDFDIASPELTAVWEKKLHEIEDGIMDKTTFINDMIEYTHKLSEQMLNTTYVKVTGTFIKAKCPVCGSRMKAVNNYYLCEYYKKENGCHFIIPKMVNGASLKDKQIEAICNGEVIDPIKMKSPKSGKPFYASLKYNNETEKVELVFEQKHYVKGICPLCHKGIISTANYYTCENYKNEAEPCEFIIAKKINNAAISEKNLEVLCSGETTDVLKMKSPKTGKDFYAALTYNMEAKKVDLIFEQDYDTGSLCPLCKHKVIATSNYYMCEQYRNKECTFVVSKEINHASLSEKMIKEICEGKTTKPVKIRSDKTGKSYYAGFKFDMDKKGLQLEFEDGHPTKYKCPECGGTLLKKTSNYGDYLTCENNDFMLRYTISGRKMKEAEIAELLEKEELKCTGFKSKNGKSFNSKLIINHGKVEFYFGKKDES